MRNIIVATLLIFAGFQVRGQGVDFNFPSFSPKGSISQVVGNTRIAIEYERPSVRKREIFGGLVPWDQVWRTGAGNATKIRFDKEVKIGGQKVAPGHYAILTIPNPDEWVVIINSDTTLYGSFDYDYNQDVARFVVIPNETSRFYETLNFDMELNQHDAALYLSWANTQISFTIETTTNAIIYKLIQEELLTGKNKVADNYAGAAAYLAYRGIDLGDALKLAEKAKDLDKESEWFSSIKIGVYESLKLYDLALEEISQAIALLKRKEDRFNEINQMETEYLRVKELSGN